MLTDLAIIKQLEREIGVELEQASINGNLTSSRGGEKAKFADQWNYFCQGYFVDDDTRVVALALSNLQLETVPPAVLRLQHLKSLTLSNNRITALPKGLEQLPHLEYLQLYDNTIRKLRPSILDLGLPVLFQIKPSVAGGILLFQNPLESPPIEIIERGQDAIRDYFGSLEEDRLPLNEAKLLLVGDGGAGKTSLVKRMLKGKFDKHEGQTHGINIDSWTVPVEGTEVKLHVWDFGGQDIMHATHQFFLSERSLYILVLDGRKEEDAEYWLKHIESFGGDSPIIVVLNKMDENPGFDINRRFLQGKYPGIVGFHRISCEKKKGIDDVKNAVAEALPHVGMIKTTWPASWFRIKTRLEAMTDPFMSDDAYAKMCAEQGITEASTQDTLVTFLHDLGVIVHFEDFHLKDTHVLEPRWLTGAVYRIINSGVLAKGHGVLKLSSLRQILKKREEDGFEYPTNKHRYIIDLMKKFRLCFSLDDKTVLVPDLLEVQEPEIDFEYVSSLRFRIDYDFLPKSVLPRFIVRKNQDIVGNLRWRTGVVLEDKAFNSMAVVKVDEAEKRIYIFVQGEQRRDYLTVIRSVFLDINRGFEKLEYVEQMPLHDDPTVTVSYAHLIRLETEGQEECYPDGAKHTYNVKELLGTVYVAKKRTEQEFIEIVRKILDESDTEQTATAKVMSAVSINPSIFGVGFDVKKAIKSFLAKGKN